MALTLLLLPWAGLLVLQAFEGMLRETAEHAGLQSVRTPALLLATEDEFFNTRSDVYRPLALGSALELDGAFDDWPGLLRFDQGVAYSIAVDERAVWVALQIENRQPQWFGQPQRQQYAFAAADHVLLQVGATDYRVVAAQSGRVQSWRLADPRQRPTNVIVPDIPARLDARIRGYWQYANNRSQIELRIPKTLLQQSVSGNASSAPVSLRFHQPNLPQLAFLESQRLHYPPIALGAWLSALAPQGRLIVVDQHGREVSRTRRIASVDSSLESAELSLSDRIAYRLLVSDPPPVLSNADIQRKQRQLLQSALNNQPATQWWQKQSFGQTWLAAAHPIRALENGQSSVVGAVLIVQPDDVVQGFTNQALARLALTTFLAFVLAAVLLLSLAAVLSWRIRRLSRAADNAVMDDGRFMPFKPSKSKDELGDLSRSFARMLRDLQSYTDYLRELAIKLSHELRTPLAVVRSSLDNLEQMPLGDDAQRYAKRAREGTLRLSAILTAMSAAKRIEQAIQTAEPERFDLSKLIDAMTQGYRDTWPLQSFELVNLAEAPVVGMPELLAQALDKLVDNARDFCRAQGRVVISLEALSETLREASTGVSSDHYVISVYNDGASLPQAMQGRLFDSMVSMRDGAHAPSADDVNKSVKDDDASSPHLGLGLYIVRLVAEAHGGYVMAKNMEQGVVFQLSIPAQM